jgi:tetratricopeptide (TPR) repeat protein
MSASPPEDLHDQHLRIGLTRLRENFLNHAELIFQRVLAARPGDPAATRLLGVTLCKLGRGGEGAALLAAACDLEPQRAEAWSDLAVALRDQGETESAGAAHARAAMILPDLAPLADQAFAADKAHHDFQMADYAYRAEIRHGSGRPSHPELAAQIGAGRERYRAFIADLGELRADFAEVPVGGDPGQAEPFWLNAWFPPLDAMALTGMLRRRDPRRFVEIGSGVSTKYARRAIGLYGLRTRLTSIDPQPRNEVDALCDEVIRQPLERCDPAVFQGLEAGDILFLDSSHRSFQGSDVTVFFLEILPRLKPGVIVHIHDIYLPDDYISGHVWRLWNEQYLLATALLFGPQAFEILFPCWYVGRDPGLAQQVRDLVCQGPLAGLNPYGASFWLRKT